MVQTFSKLNKSVMLLYKTFIQLFWVPLNSKVAYLFWSVQKPNQIKRMMRQFLMSWHSHIYHHFFFIQTVTYLDLQNNQIRDSGAQYLSEALKSNKVKFISFLHIFISCLLFLLFNRQCSIYTSRITVVFPLIRKLVWNNKTIGCLLIN
jgi:hypothetical protein